jgi:hypothetical protein
MSITFSSSFYSLKSKFDTSVYIQWMNNFLSIVNEFRLVIYTDAKSVGFIDTKNNPRIRVVVKPLENFYLHKHKEKWIKNHEKNELLNDKTTWELNMLWNEKINFVNETAKMQYFITDYYGWCDVGYFRNRHNDIHTDFLADWAHPSVFSFLDKNKIYYANVNRDDEFMKNLMGLVKNKNEDGLPVVPIPADQKSIAGGFFLIHKDKIDWWVETYYEKLDLYFQHDYLVKDDQILIADCIFSQPDEFVLIKEGLIQYDIWFAFQRMLFYNKPTENPVVETPTQVVETPTQVVETPEEECIELIINENDKLPEPIFEREKKISILMCIHNGIEFINDSVFSVINQTYTNWELLIGINGYPANSSVFQTAKYIQDIYGDGKITVYDFPDIKGKAKTLNRLVPLCKNDYVAILDVDDMWLPEKLKTQVPFLNNYDVVGSNCVYFGDINGTVPPIPPGDFSNFDFNQVNPVINSSSIIRKELCYWNENGIDGVEDYDLWLRLRKQQHKFYNCSEVLVNHRIHQQSAFNSKDNQHLVQKVKEENM